MHSLDQKHLARIVLLTFGILVVACVVYTLVLNVCVAGRPQRREHKRSVLATGRGCLCRRLGERRSRPQPKLQRRR